jgi:hypothetical protein
MLQRDLNHLFDFDSCPLNYTEHLCAREKHRPNSNKACATRYLYHLKMNVLPYSHPMVISSLEASLFVAYLWRHIIAHSNSAVESFFLLAHLQVMQVSRFKQAKAGDFFKKEIFAFQKIFSSLFFLLHLFFFSLLILHIFLFLKENLLFIN